MTKQTLFTQINKNKRKTIGFMIGFFFIIELFAIFIGFLGGLVVLSFMNHGAMLFLLAVCVIMPVIAFIYVNRILNDSVDIIMSMNNGSEIQDHNKYPVLWDAVNNMALAANLPMPRIFIINDKSPNAFSVGKDPRHAAIGATTGLLDSMDEYEIEGVIGHEMSHIKGYDTRVETIGIALTSGFVLMGHKDIIEPGSMTKLHYRNNFDYYFWNVNYAVALMTLPIWICAGLCYLMQLALSRNREYLADEGSVDLTRNPDELIRALESLEHRPSMKEANPFSNALYFVDPYAHKRRFISQLLDTHPPLDKRIARLKKLAN